MVIPQRLLSPEERNNDSVPWSEESCSALTVTESFLFCSSRKIRKERVVNKMLPLPRASKERKKNPRSVSPCLLST